MSTTTNTDLTARLDTLLSELLALKAEITSAPEPKTASKTAKKSTQKRTVLTCKHDTCGKFARKDTGFCGKHSTSEAQPATPARKGRNATRNAKRNATQKSAPKIADAKALLGRVKGASMGTLQGVAKVTLPYGTDIDSLKLDTVPVGSDGKLALAQADDGPHIVLRTKPTRKGQRKAELCAMLADGTLVTVGHKRVARKDLPAPAWAQKTPSGKSFEYYPIG